MHKKSSFFRHSPRNDMKFGQIEKWKLLQYEHFRSIILGISILWRTLIGSPLDSGNHCNSILNLSVLQFHSKNMLHHTLSSFYIRRHKLNFFCYLLLLTLCSQGGGIQVLPRGTIELWALPEKRRKGRKYPIFALGTVQSG